MKENKDKYLDKLVGNIMMENSLEVPSADFTGKVMANILTADQSKATVYKPLISKKVWFVIVAGIIASIGFIFLQGGAPSSGKPEMFGLAELDYTTMFRPLPGFQISRITVIVVVLSTLLVFIQIFLLNNYLNKRLRE